MAAAEQALEIGQYLRDVVTKWRARSTQINEDLRAASQRSNGAIRNRLEAKIPRQARGGANGIYLTTVVQCRECAAQKRSRVTHREDRRGWQTRLPAGSGIDRGYSSAPGGGVKR